MHCPEHTSLDMKRRVNCFRPWLTYFYIISVKMIKTNLVASFLLPSSVPHPCHVWPQLFAESVSWFHPRYSFSASVVFMFLQLSFWCKIRHVGTCSNVVLSKLGQYVLYIAPYWIEIRWSRHERCVAFDVVVINMKSEPISRVSVKCECIPLVICTAWLQSYSQSIASPRDDTVSRMCVVSSNESCHFINISCYWLCM